MASQLDICNLALYKLGETLISSTELTAKAPKAAELCDAFWATIRDECLEAHPWNFAIAHKALDYTDDFGLFPTDGTDNDVTTVTDITKADPANVEISSHPYLTGDIINITDVSGMVEVNGRVFTATYVDADNVTIGVDSTKYTTYTSGGEAIRLEAVTTYSGGYTYDVPSDCLRPLNINNDRDIEFTLIGKDEASPSTGEEASNRILTTVKDAVLVYIAQVTETTYWTNRFVNLVASRLAGELAIPLKKKAADFELMMKTYEYHLGKAKLNNSQETNLKPNTTDKWLYRAGYSN